MSTVKELREKYRKGEIDSPKSTTESLREKIQNDKSYADTVNKYRQIVQKEEYDAIGVDTLNSDIVNLYNNTVNFVNEDKYHKTEDYAKYNSDIGKLKNRYLALQKYMKKYGIEDEETLTGITNAMTDLSNLTNAVKSNQDYYYLNYKDEADYNGKKAAREHQTLVASVATDPKKRAELETELEGLKENYTSDAWRNNPFVSESEKYDKETLDRINEITELLKEADSYTPPKEEEKVEFADITDVDNAIAKTKQDFVNTYGNTQGDFYEKYKDSKVDWNLVKGDKDAIERAKRGYEMYIETGREDEAKSLYLDWLWDTVYSDYLDKIDNLESTRDNMTKEQRYASYMDLVNNDDFIKNSVYKQDGAVTTQNDTIKLALSPKAREFVEKKKDGSGYGTFGKTTQTENLVFQYLWNTQGEDAAMEYYNFLNDNYLLDREANAVMETTYNVGKKAPVLGSALSVGTMLTSGAEFLGDLAYSIATGKTVPNISGKATQGFRAGAASNIDNEILQKGYHLLMSSIDSIVAAKIPMGHLFIGGSVAANAYNDAAENGVGTKGAILNGLMQGFFEGFFERFTIGNLKAMREMTPANWADIAKNILIKQGITNATEEAATEFADIIAEYLSMGNASELVQRYQKYIDEGLSESEARLKTLGDMGMRIGEAGLGGGIQGMFMGGIGSIQAGINTAKIGSSQTNETMAKVKELGLKTNPDSRAYKLASNLSEESSNMYKGGTLAQVLEEVYGNNTAEVVAAEIETLGYSAKESRSIANEMVDIISKSETVDDMVMTRKLSRAIANTESMEQKNGLMKLWQSLKGTGIMASENPNKANIKTANEIYSEAIKNNIAAERRLKGTEVETPTVEDSEVSKILNNPLVSHETKETLKERLKEGTAEAYINEITGKNAIDRENRLRAAENKTVIVDGEEHSIKEIESTGDRTILKLENDKLVNADNVEVKDETVAALLTYSKTLPTGAARTMFSAYDGRTDADTFGASYKSVFGLASIGIDEDTIRETKFAKDLSPSQFKAAFYGGQNAQKSEIDRISKRQEMLDSIRLKKAAENGIQIKKGSIKNNLPKKLDKNVKEAVDFVAEFSKISNLNYVISDDVVGNGEYYKGTVYLNPNNMKINGEKNVILQVLGHELTHFAKEFSPKEYSEFKDFLFNEINKYDKYRVADLVRQKIQERKDYIEKHPKQDVKELSWQEAEEEVVCDACINMLQDGSAIQKLAEANLSFTEKLINKICELLDKVVALLSNPRLTREYAALQDVKADFEVLQIMWNEMLVNASENYQLAKEEGLIEKTEFTQAISDKSMNSITTEKQEFPKMVMPLGSGKGKLFEQNGKNTYTVRAIRDMVMEQNVQNKVKGWDNARVKRVQDFMSDMADFMEEMGVTYHFVGLDDVKNAKLHYEYNADGTVKRVVISAMVKNGDYPVNFDFSTICKQRKWMQKTIDALCKRNSKNGNIKLIDDFVLGKEDIWAINEILKSKGYETQCLGCFVESKRYNIEEWARSFVKKWNDIVDSVVGKGKAEYYNFVDNNTTFDDLSPKEAESLTKTLEKYMNKKGGTKSNLAKIKDLVSSGEQFQKKLHISDLITADGIAQIRTLSSEMYGILCGHYGTGTPKMVQGFTPYNSEIALLPDKKGKTPISDYLKEIAGIRTQSFSDFQIANVYDYLQMFTDAAAREFPLHAYTKVVAFAKLFGMTGAKINMSVMFDIDPNTDDAHAGLIRDKNGEWQYIIADKKRSDRVYNENVQKLIAEGMSEAEAKKKAFRPFIQSATFDEAVALQNTDGYRGNVGIIGVGFSKYHILKMLSDINFRYVIPYHASGLPLHIKNVAHLDKATDYTSVQNTMVLKNITVSEGKGKRNKTVTFDLNESYRRLGSWQKAFAEFNNWLDGLREQYDKVTVNTSTAQQYAYDDDGNQLFTKKGNPKKKKQQGHGTFDLYGDLEKTKDPRQTANNYIDWCMQNGFLPIFYEFAGHENYYKLLYDFEVYDSQIIDGKLVEKYAPQGIVTNTYPGFNDRTGGDAQGLKDAIEHEMSWQNEYNKHQEEIFEETLSEITDTITPFNGERKNQLPTDEEYLELAKNPEKNEARLREMVDEASSKYLNSLLLPNDDDEVGFKYHRGAAPTKTFKRYAVFNVSEDGFKAAYAGNKTPTPVGVWLDAQNLQSYMSDMVQFDDGTFASYIPGDTGAATNTKFSQEKIEEYGLRGGQRWLLERGGKHSSDVPNFSQMNLKKDENGNKVTNALRDGALPHNKLVFEIEYGISEEGDLTEYVRENGRMMKGKNQGLAKIGSNQYYDFKTNSNAVGNWGIGGTFRITRIVPYDEVVSVTEKYKQNSIAEAERLYEEGEISRNDRDTRIKNANAIQVQKWVGGYHPEEFGITSDSMDELVATGSKMKLTDLVTYDDNGNIIPLSERFNKDIDDIRYQLPTESEDWDADRWSKEYDELQEDYDYLLENVKSIKNKNRNLKAQNKRLQDKNAKLKKDLDTQKKNGVLYENLKKQFELTEGHKINRNSIDKYATRLRVDNQSKYDKTELTNRLEALYNKMANGEIQDLNSSTNEFVKEATSIAVDIVDNFVKKEEVNVDAETIFIAQDIIQKYFDMPEVRTKADMHQKELDLLKAHYKNRISKLREYYKDKFSKEAFVERANRDTYKERIKKKVKKLSEAIIRPTKDSHIPDQLRIPLGQFLETIDFSSKRRLKGGEDTKKDETYLNRLDSLRFALENINRVQQSFDEKNVNPYLDLPGDFVKVIDTYVNDAKEHLSENSKVVNKMTAEDLKMLDHILTVLNRSVNKINKTYANRQFATTQALGEATISRLNHLGARGKYLTSIKDYLTWTLTNPYYGFKRFGQGGQAVFEAIQDGQDRYTFLIKQIIDFTKNLYSPKEAREWQKKTHDFEIGRKTITMTEAQMMSLYCLDKRDQAKGHIYGDGIRVSDINQGIKTIHAQDTTLTEEDVKKIVSELDERQKYVADEIQKFMSTICSQWGNEVSLARFGYSAYLEGEYFPIEVISDVLATKDTAQIPGTEIFRLLNLSSSKPTVEGAKNMIMVRDIFDVFANHSSDMAKLNSFGLPLLDTIKWLNYQRTTETTDGRNKVEGVKKSINQTFGEGAIKFIMNELKNYNGKFEGADLNGAEKFVKNRMSSAKVASVGANLRVAALQLTAYPKAMMVLSPGSLAKGLARKPSIKKAKENCGIALWKSYGFYDVNVSMGLEHMIKHDESFIDKTKEAMMKPAQVGDEITWGYLWNACEEEVKKTNKHLEVGSDAFNKEVARLLRDVVYRTQVVDSTLTRSQIMKSKSVFSQILTPFMSEPLLTYNIVKDKILDFHDDVKMGMNKKALLSKYGKSITRTMGSLAITEMLVVLIQSIGDIWRDDDDETAEEKWESFSEYLVSNLKAELNPLSYIPIVKDAWNYVDSTFFGGYSNSSRLDNAYLEYISKAVETWQDIIENGENAKSTPYGAIYKTAQALSWTVGIPGSATMRELTSLWNNTMGYILPNTRITTTKYYPYDDYQRLYDASLSGADDKYKVAFNRLMSYGYGYNDIANGISKILKEKDSRITQAGQYLYEGDLVAYKKICEDIISDGIDREVVIKSARSIANKLKSDANIEGSSEETSSDGYTSWYRTSDLNIAIASGENISTVANDILQAKMSTGKSEKDAKTSIRASLTSHWKSIYVSSNSSERQRIRKNLYETGCYDSLKALDKILKGWLD